MSREELLAELARLREELREHGSSSLDAKGRAGTPEGLLRRVVDQAPDMIWARDLDKRFLYVNKAACRGLLNTDDLHEPIGRDVSHFVRVERENHPSNSQWHTFGEVDQESDNRVLERLEAGRFDESAYVRGELLHLDVHKAPLFDETGHPMGTVCCAQDVTNHRKHLEDLRHSENRFKSIFNNTDISIWEKDASRVKAALDALEREGVTDFRAYCEQHPEYIWEAAKMIRVLDVNNATLELYGARTKEELLGGLDRVLLPESGPMLMEFLVAIAEGATRFEHETVNRTLDGRILNILVRLIIPRDEDYGSLLFCIVDITAKKQMEAARTRNQQLESLGVLAGGIAHDFNNLLMGITGGISLAKMYMEKCDQLQVAKPLASLNTSERACERAKNLTHQLLTFARGGAPVKRALPVGKLLRDAASFGLSGSNVRCAFVLPDGIWNIEADENQLIQVISNVVLNGAESMPEGGTLNVEARNRWIQDREIPGLPAGKVVEIRVQDFGVGIPQDHLHQVFDPYFTAKSGGRGLGLAIAHSVIVKHGGHVRLDSEVGAGTIVTILMPATETQPQDHTPVQDGTRTQAGFVLVMDDEDIVRETASAMLECLGYTVGTAADGLEMLAKYRSAMERGAGYDLVIMDLTVPGGMGGAEGMKELLALDPDAKALVSSGYFNDPIMANFEDYGFSGVVPKPYRMEDLRREIKAVQARTKV